MQDDRALSGGSADVNDQRGGLARHLYMGSPETFRAVGFRDVTPDCLVMRVASASPIIPFLVLGGLPMQIALVIGLPVMFQRRRRREKPLRFLIGFEVVGWICHLIYVVLCFEIAARSIDRHLGETLGPLLRATGFQPFSTASYICRVALAMSYVNAPQLAAALIAGWISQRWWTWWKQTHPQTVLTQGTETGARVVLVGAKGRTQPGQIGVVAHPFDSA